MDIESLKLLAVSFTRKSSFRSHPTMILHLRDGKSSFRRLCFPEKQFYHGCVFYPPPSISGAKVGHMGLVWKLLWEKEKVGPTVTVKVTSCLSLPSAKVAALETVIETKVGRVRNQRQCVEQIIFAFVKIHLLFAQNRKSTKVE